MGLEAKASMLPFIVGAMAMFEVTAPSSAFKVEYVRLGLAVRPQGQRVQRSVIAGFVAARRPVYYQAGRTPILRFSLDFNAS